MSPARDKAEAVTDAQSTDRRYRNPVYPGYFADPFVLRTDDGYFAYGTGSVVGRAGVRAADLAGPDPVDARRAAPSVTPARARTSATPTGRRRSSRRTGVTGCTTPSATSDAGHHLRVAVADEPLGPFVDTGTNLTPHERFAIDAAPVPRRRRQLVPLLRPRRAGRRAGRHPPRGRPADLDLTATAGRPRSVLRAERRLAALPARPPDVRAGLGLAHARGPDGGAARRPLLLPLLRRRVARRGLLAGVGAGRPPARSVARARAGGRRGCCRRCPATSPGPGTPASRRRPGGADVLVYHAWDPPGTARRMCFDR